MKIPDQVRNDVIGSQSEDSCQHPYNESRQNAGTSVMSGESIKPIKS